MQIARPMTLALLVLAVAACHRDVPAPATAVTAAAAPAGLDKPWSVHDWPLPSTIGSAQPDLALTPDGRVLLSWISSVSGRRNALQFVAMADNGHWQSAPRTIAVGNTLMANWANVPHIAQTADGAFWVQFMQQRGSGHAGDVALSHSSDGGFNWSAPIAVNDDGVEAEHGFAALWPASRDSIGVAWLNGGEGGDAGTAHGGAGMDADDGMQHGEGRTSLRAAVFDMNLQRGNAAVLDAKTCDCCQSEIVATARGPLLAYRDRSDQEVRDIVVVRNDGGNWGKPVLVHADGWVMRGCPVNGPAIAAHGDNVVVAWFTAANERPLVQVARSGDAGDSFGAPVVLEQGAAVQGRAAVALDARQAFVLWLREDAGGQSLWLSRRSPDLARELQRIEVAKLQGRGRGTGFPQIVLRDGDAYIAWTDIIDGAPHLRGAVVTPAGG